MQAGRDHDIIFVNKHTFLMRIGIEPFEADWRQTVQVSFRLLVPAAARKAGDFVSYAPVIEHLRDLAASGRHIRLIEELADMVCRKAMEDPRVVTVETTVAKQDVFPDAEAVGITITMDRDEV